MDICKKAQFNDLCFFHVCLQSTSCWRLGPQGPEGEAVLPSLRAAVGPPAVRPEQHRCALVTYQHVFTKVDSCYKKKLIFLSGNVSVSEWAQVLESVLRLDLPWRTLRPHLARLAADGSVDYQSCFEDMEPGIPLPQVRKGKVSPYNRWKATKYIHSNTVLIGYFEILIFYLQYFNYMLFLHFRGKCCTFYSTTFIWCL